jgi:hypothetical protein
MPWISAVNWFLNNVATDNETTSIVALPPLSWGLRIVRLERKKKSWLYFRRLHFREDFLVAAKTSFHISNDSSFYGFRLWSTFQFRFRSRDHSWPLNFRNWLRRQGHWFYRKVHKYLRKGVVSVLLACKTWVVSVDWSVRRYYTLCEQGLS